MKKIIAAIAFVLLVFGATCVRAEDAVRLPVTLCRSGDVYSVDYDFSVSTGAAITDVSCTVSGCYFDWNYIESERRLLISLASGSVLPKTDALFTITADAGTQLSETAVLINGKTEPTASAQHTESEIAAVPPTCGTAGQTAGKKCAVCGYIMQAPQPVPALGPVVHASLSPDGTLDLTGSLSDDTATDGITLLEVLAQDGRVLASRDITSLDQSGWSLSLPSCTGAVSVRITRVDEVTNEPLQEPLVFPVQTGFTVKGTVTTFGDEHAPVTISLMQGDDVKYETTVLGNRAEYAISGVAPGSYILRVQKQKHVTRDYPITIGVGS